MATNDRKSPRSGKDQGRGMRGRDFAGADTAGDEREQTETRRNAPDTTDESGETTTAAVPDPTPSRTSKR